jgi:hypothetical protein
MVQLHFPKNNKADYSRLYDFVILEIKKSYIRLHRQRKNNVT